MSITEEDISFESERRVDEDIPPDDHTLVVSSKGGIEPLANLQLSDLPSE